MDKMDKKSLLQMGYASSIGIAMVLAIFGSLYFGIWLDKKLGTGSLFHDSLSGHWHRGGFQKHL